MPSARHGAIMTPTCERREGARKVRQLGPHDQHAHRGESHAHTQSEQGGNDRQLTDGRLPSDDDDLHMAAIGRNAHNDLPEPVGRHMRTSKPSASAAITSTCFGRSGYGERSDHVSGGAAGSEQDV